MAGMTLYNSLTRRLEELRPLDPSRVGLYTCGPTVYNYQHVGNYRTYVFEDVLVKALESMGYRVQREMNITDVGHLTSQADEGEDKMEVGAAREGKTAWEVAKFFTQAFLEDCRALNIRLPEKLRNATDHIPEQLELIKRLEEKGFVYKTSDGLYYDAGRFPGYDRLAGAENIAGLKAGFRVAANPEKRGSCDFALWKFSPPGKKRDMEWDSPWGKGFPGWHIECSAMAMKYLGESFDIHCGGIDHVPIHHTNEIAQTEGATGKPFVSIWMHGEFLLMNSAKMAKSSGGFVTVRDLKEKGFDPLDFRYHCMTAHYRKQLDFTWEALEGAKTSRRRLRDAAAVLAGEALKPACAEYKEKFDNSLRDDLNLPAALAAVWEAVRDESLPAGSRKAFLEQAESVLGLGLFQQESVELPGDLMLLLEARAQARARKDFALSDKLRRELESRGILVEDTSTGQKWRFK